jgi:hypothetical protein
MGSSILGCSPATTQGRRSYRYLCGFTPEGGPGRALPLRWSTPVHQPNQSGLHLEEEDWIGLEFGRQSWPPKRFATSEPSKSCNKSCTVTLSVPEHLAKRLELQPNGRAFVGTELAPATGMKRVSVGPYAKSFRNRPPLS